MPELRQDIITGRWVVVATDRAKRPENFSLRRVEEVPVEGSCPFCPGNEDQTPPEVDAFRPDGSGPDKPGWNVRVVPNKYPAFSLNYESMEDDPVYHHEQALGLHEVIIHSPDHGRNLGSLPVNQVEAVIEMYQKRYRFAMSQPGVKSTMIIVNHGREAGASLEHSHSQLFAMPLVPNELKNELEGMSRHLKAGGDCIFCDMLSHEMRMYERVVAENSRFVAFCPYASRGPFETWILPREHLSAFELADVETRAAFSELLHYVLGAMKEKLKDPPYNYWLHTKPAEADDFHWHLEILPKLTTPAGFEMGTGMLINILRPEDAAGFLRAE